MTICFIGMILIIYMTARHAKLLGGNRWKYIKREVRKRRNWLPNNYNIFLRNQSSNNFFFYHEDTTSDIN